MDQTLDLTQSIQQAINGFSVAWFFGASMCCYLLVQIFRGKAGFEIPYLTPWLEKQSKEAKTYIILLFFALAGMFAAFGSEHVTIGVIIDGFLEGLALGIGANGVRNTVKQGIEAVQTHSENKKQPEKQE
jgi:hypothetical protein